MYNKFFFKQLLLVLTVIVIVSCDKDYNEIGASLISQNHFELANESSTTVQSEWSKTGPLASNNLEINALGILDNKAFGQTTSRFASQVQLASVNPEFNLALSQTVESVTLYIPYFTNTTVVTNATTGAHTYTLDSIYGEKTAKIKLRIYENKYLLDDKNTEGGGAPLLDPNYPQFYYTNQNSLFNNYKGQLLFTKNDFVFSPDEFKVLTAATTTTAESTAYIKPGMQLELNKTFFQTLLFSTSSNTNLTTNAIFEKYFKGLYFDVEKVDVNGVLTMLNFKKGTIVVKYKEKTSTTDTALVDKSFTLNLTGNTVNLLNNDFTTSGTEYNSNPIADRLYLRGGEGSVATINLFNPTIDVVTYNKITKTIVAGSNGIPDELDYIKSKGWLINEASLTFYIDQTAMAGVTEPSRIFLYDINNKRPLIDYYYDGSSGNSANYTKQFYGGIIEKNTSGRGLRYKFRITNHIRNIVNNDSTNVKIGVSLAQSITNIIYKKKGNNSSVPIYSVWKNLTTTQKNAYYFPESSIISPLGTILYGSGANVPEESRLKLKIYYTKPN
jgi:hypothetical protein